jgi:hypothetical protein
VRTLAKADASAPTCHSHRAGLQGQSHTNAIPTASRIPGFENIGHIYLKVHTIEFRRQCPKLRANARLAVKPRRILTRRKGMASYRMSIGQEALLNLWYRGLSAFMFYSTAQREAVKANNPGISFGEYRRLQMRYQR